MARPRHFCGVSGELKSDEVLAINPRGQAPTFKDGDVIVNESMALMQYVEEAYPEPPLLPHAADKVERALAYQRFHETSTLYSALGPIFIAKMTGAVNTEDEQVHLRQWVFWPRSLCSRSPNHVHAYQSRCIAMPSTLPRGPHAAAIPQIERKCITYAATICPPRGACCRHLTTTID